MDHIGQRSEFVLGGFVVEHSLVTQKSFNVGTGLPPSLWYGPNGFFMSGLVVASEEDDHFMEHYGQRVRSHPYRLARRFKYTYGMDIVVAPQEDPSIKASLMDFRLFCLTQFTPCQSEDQILPAGWKLMEEDRNAASVPQIPTSPAPAAPSK